MDYKRREASERKDARWRSARPGRASWHHHHHHHQESTLVRYLTCYLTYLRYSGTVTSGRLSTRPLIKSLEHVELPQLSQTQSDIPVFHLGGHSRSAYHHIYHHIYHHLSRTDMTRQSCWTDRCTGGELLHFDGAEILTTCSCESMFLQELGVWRKRYVADLCQLCWRSATCVMGK